jgi:hypothetical protein
MLSRLKQAALSVVGSSSNRPDRAQLRAAIVARDDAQRMLDEDRLALDRLQEVIDRAADASRVALSAKLKANEARRRWVLDNCPDSASSSLQSLDDAASAAAQVAAVTAQDSDVITTTQGLERAEGNIRFSKKRLRGAEDGITGAIAVILAAEAAPLLRRFEQIAEEYRDIRAKVIGVRLVLEQPWSLDNKNKMNPAHEGERVVEAALARARIESFDRERAESRARDSLNKTCDEQNWLDGLTAPWRERAKALRENPDA